MTVTGPTFIALQVHDLERAATFYQTHLGLRRTPASPLGAVVFDTVPASFAVREPLPASPSSASPSTARSGARSPSSTPTVRQ